mgnify:CR=1 FL=1
MATDIPKLCPLKVNAYIPGPDDSWANRTQEDWDVEFEIRYNKVHACDRERCEWWMNGPADAGGQCCAASSIGTICDHLNVIAGRMR